MGEATLCNLLRLLNVQVPSRSGWGPWPDRLRAIPSDTWGCRSASPPRDLPHSPSSPGPLAFAHDWLCLPPRGLPGCTAFRTVEPFRSRGPEDTPHWVGWGSAPCLGVDRLGSRVHRTPGLRIQISSNQAERDLHPTEVPGLRVPGLGWAAEQSLWLGHSWGTACRNSAHPDPCAGRCKPLPTSPSQSGFRWLSLQVPCHPHGVSSA